MVGMDRNLSINEVNETGENRPQYQTEEELLHSMGYKQVNYISNQICTIDHLLKIQLLLIRK